MPYRKRPINSDGTYKKHKNIDFSKSVSSDEKISGGIDDNSSETYTESTLRQSLQAKIDAAKERLKNRIDTKEEEEEEGRGGLNVAIHPLLRPIQNTPVLPRNHNPLKQNVKKWFDPTALNPYLNQSDMGGFGTKFKSRPLQLNPQGKYISQGNDIREKYKRQQAELKLMAEEKSLGLIPDDSIGENLYKPEYPPSVEWWDKPYLKDNNYNRINDDDNIILDSEIAPVTIYVQHPVLLPPPWEPNQETGNKLYLTKKEMKRKRRNERQTRHKDQQDRIKLGLDPPPPPKVKLSNLMNVLTNEAIKDPTSVEMRVREEVKERFERHMRANDERKLTREQKQEKAQTKKLKDLSNGFFTTVYKIDMLENPQHLFKIDINAKQLELVGICLTNPKFNLIIVEGGAKSLKFYKKLLCNRIKWKENVLPKNAVDNSTPTESEIKDLSSNKCIVLWEGQVKELNFKKWSIMKTQNDEEAFDVLNRFGVESYWRQALVSNE